MVEIMDEKGEIRKVSLNMLYEYYWYFTLQNDPLS
jgi:hypothetical protein